MNKYFLCAGILLFAGVALAAPEPKRKVRILVIDIERVIDRTEEGRALVVALKQRVAEEETRLAAEQVKLQEKQRELQQAKLVDKTEEYYEELKTALDGMAKFARDKQFFILKLKDDISRHTNDILRGAQTEARKIMKKRGADIVLITRTSKLQINNDKQFEAEILTRRALCYTKNADITDEVIKKMNDWFRANKRKDAPLPKRDGDKGRVQRTKKPSDG